MALPSFILRPLLPPKGTCQLFILGGSKVCLPEAGGNAGEGGMSGLGGHAVGPGLCEGDLLLEEPESRLAGRAGQGLGRKRGWELFWEDRAGGWVWA